MNKDRLKNIKVGVKVWSYSFQEWGIVSSINAGRTYPLVVRFLSRKSPTLYKRDGRLYNWHKAPDLFVIEMCLVPIERKN